jgi:hypothetical protein
MNKNTLRLVVLATVMFASTMSVSLSYANLNEYNGRGCWGVVQVSSIDSGFGVFNVSAAPQNGLQSCISNFNWFNNFTRLYNYSSWNQRGASLTHEQST